MFDSFPILSFITFFPIFGVLLNLLLGSSEKLIKIVKINSLVISIIMLILILLLYPDLKSNSDGQKFLFEEATEWFRAYGVSYKLGLDGLSWLFLFLTGLLIPICIISSWREVTDKVALFYSCFLILETFIVGVFTARDLVLFYIYFEAVLIPMYIIIGVWGGENRVYASIKFFLFTLAGSVLFLLVVVYLIVALGTSDMSVISSKIQLVDLGIQKYLWMAAFVAFAVKVPMWPFHTWLPDAHVQAPTAGSVILAGVLLKLGGYGFIRVSLDIFYNPSIYFANFVIFLSVVAVLYASFVAFYQKNMKKLIAYSSIAHMGYVTAGIFSLNELGIQGAIFQMFSHGITSAALFLVVGIFYEKIKTKEIAKYGGCAEKMPLMAVFFFIFTMSSIGLPGTAGFVGEFVSMLGIFSAHKIYSMLMVVGVVMGAVYMLSLYRKVMFGKLSSSCAEITDINKNEFVYLFILAVIVVVLGFSTSSVTELSSSMVNSLIGKI